MSDKFVDPILAEGFDPNGPEPNVVYSRNNIINLNSFQQNSAESELNNPELLYTKALEEGATEEEAARTASLAFEALHNKNASNENKQDN